MTVPVVQHPPAPPTAHRLLENARGLTEPALGAWVSRLPGLTGRLTGYHLGRLDERGEALAAPVSGKSVRPALVYGCCTAAGGRAEDA
ncbi:hypothetical protein [Streptomyces sp. NPDC057623]|uniref:hypothetical protein n=1 Tax=Streptomyces sp. NPDC057623 TaxID=3346187 RepID=UPI0036CAEEED